MIDKYSNYFLQKLYGFMYANDKIVFLTYLKPYLSEVGNDSIGTFSLQAIIEQMITKEERRYFSEALKETFIHMVNNKNGVHVIEKLIICFNENEVNFIYDFVISNFILLACDINGLCLTKKIVQFSKSPSTIKRILETVLPVCENLIQNQHGNYTIQAILEYWSTDSVSLLLNKLTGKYISFSMQKTSSNVMEKCIELGGDVVISRFIEEVKITKKIVDLIKNNYGNFVVQKALKVANQVNRRLLSTLISKNLHKLTDRKLEEKWRALININNNDCLKYSKVNNNLYEQYVHNIKYINENNILNNKLRNFDNNFTRNKQKNDNNLLSYPHELIINNNTLNYYNNQEQRLLY